jgi:hypothetical protein
MTLCASSKTRLDFQLQQHAGMVAGDFDRRLALAQSS